MGKSVRKIPSIDWYHLDTCSGNVQHKSRTVVCVHTNGNQIGRSTSNTGNQDFAADWRVGSTNNYNFHGDIAEVKIWKKALLEPELKKSMKGEINLKDDDLAGYWPMNDGVGLTVQDLSRHNHPGSLGNGCHWLVDERPILKEVPQEPCAYGFHKNVIKDAIWYTNGECVAIIYPIGIVSTVFLGRVGSVPGIFPRNWIIG
eukprot:TRINITY_DN4997_c0_g1_i1.p1 TRINITY_DN4997_c0_g1~~TRINITY_DN4997_c0_g1_i1.p1  ORF type:complete len:201 (-),score=13.41 TRINITY_DN4997_c0_g1_i1:153-755(-)